MTSSICAKNFTSIAIIGSGKMGTDIFFYLSGFSFQLIMVCESPAHQEAFEKILQRKIRRDLSAEIISDETSRDIRHRLKTTADLSACKGADLIIECIPEDLGRKRDLFESLDRDMPPQCVFASNSSSLAPSRIFGDMPRRRLCVGLHFFTRSNTRILWNL